MFLILEGIFSTSLYWNKNKKTVADITGDELIEQGFELSEKYGVKCYQYPSKKLNKNRRKGRK